jgi:hypothetical protein
LFDAIEWVQGIIDVPTEHAFKGIDYVYHSAALISFDQKKTYYAKPILKGQQTS